MTHTHTRMHTCIHTYIPTYLRTYVRTYIHTQTYIHTFIHSYIQTYYIYINTHTHKYVHLYASTTLFTLGFIGLSMSVGASTCFRLLFHSSVPGSACKARNWCRGFWSWYAVRIGLGMRLEKCLGMKFSSWRHERLSCHHNGNVELSHRWGALKTTAVTTNSKLGL